jgi:predicted nicotinamide N-methyase
VSSSSELAPELRALERRFVLARRTASVGGRDVVIESPRSAEDLISEADFERDERLPYWADLWPSATVLANIVAPLDGKGRRALELGCGLGLVTIGALRAGFDILATDYYEDALLFARRNARRATGREPCTRHVDWRARPSDLGAFDLVLASDVLYERPYAPLVAAAVAATLAPGGTALVADPGRVALDSFLTECGARGCSARVCDRVHWSDGTARQTITIHEITRST